MGKRLKLYNVNLKYIRNLHNIDSHVPSISPQIGKQNRPFLGIIVMVNGSKYCIPLSSNSAVKNKDINSMRENITLRKIQDKDGKILAILNINNMLPIREEYITEINLKIKSTDSKSVKQWKKLCAKELDWCQANSDEIEHLANELYRKYCSGESFKKRKICLDYPALEKECNKAKTFSNKKLTNNESLLNKE